MRSHFIQQTLGIIPSQTRVGDGFSVDVFADFLAAWFDVALDHDSFDEVTDIVGVTTAVEYFLDDTDLLHVFFVGVGVVCIDDTSRILQITLVVEV